MKIGDFMKQAEKQLKKADKQVKKRRLDEGRVIYEQLAAFFRDLREAQRRDVPGQTIPLSLRLMVANRDLMVPLDRLGELHLQLGNAREAARYFREEVEAMEEAVSHAGGESKAQFEALLAEARRKLAAAEGLERPVPRVDHARYAARYQHLMRQITNMSRVPGEATLLLARRILQRPPASLSQADLRRAVAEINQLPNYTEPLTEAEIDRLVAERGALIHSLASELASVYRDHPDLT
jgi:hypothetical protein